MPVRTKHRHYFAPRVLYTSIVVLLCGCSFFSTPATSTSLQLSAIPEWQQVGSSPYVYKIRDSSIFLTAIRDCNDGKFSPMTTTRRLLVGMKKIQIDRQEALTIKGYQGLISEMRAELDEQELRLATISVKGTPCVTDFVLWTPDSQTGLLESKINGVAEYLSSHFDSILATS